MADIFNEEENDLLEPAAEVRELAAQALPVAACSSILGCG
jgi:hypothetical protein